jgi:NADPH:quinone reductase-like Zn-dependent oxidoreductase
VVEAASTFDRGFPMLMTAAGTIPAANVFVMGAGVAGLQAIATARRLGGRVSATDVRPAAKEEIKSLGASFVGHEDEESKAAQTAGGYAKQLSANFYAEQAKVVAAHIAKQDIVVTTALVQGRKAPTLVTAEMVASMKPGSVIVDIASDAGGNVGRHQAGRDDGDRERREGAGLHQLARPDLRRVLGPLCAQPADLPDHLLGQGRQEARAAGGRRHREGRRADPRRRRRPSLLRSLSSHPMIETQPSDDRRGVSPGGLNRPAFPKETTT